MTNSPYNSHEQNAALLALKPESGMRYQQLKLKSNSSVIVHPFKSKTYTREELEEIAANAHSHGYNLCLGTSDMLEFKEWFSKNYPE